MLTEEQIDFFQKHGFLRLEQVYSPDELRAAITLNLLPRSIACARVTFE